MSLYLGSTQQSLWLNGTRYNVNVLRKQQQEGYDVLKAYFTTESIIRSEKATLMVETTVGVETLTMVNKVGKDQTFSIISVELVGGIKVWTVQFRITSTGTQTFTVTGHGADGTTGQTASASIQVTLK